MSIIDELIGKSPFGPLVEHTKKVYECVKMVKPLTEALIKEDHDEIHRLQDKVSKLEYEADQIKQEIRQHLPRRYLLPVHREELDTFLRCQDRIADSVEDFAVILLIRDTKLHPSLQEPFREFADQVVKVGNILLEAAEELQNLAETAFGGAEAKAVLGRIAGLSEEEWKADKMQRLLCRKVYSVEGELDAVTIMFYDKLFQTLSRIANEAENTGDLLRVMIVKR